MAAYLIESQRASKEALARETEQETNEQALGADKAASENALFAGEVSDMSSPHDVGQHVSGGSGIRPDHAAARKVAADIESRVRSYGVQIVRGDPGERPRVEWDDGGNISLIYHPDEVVKFDTYAQTAGEAPGETARTVLDGEEVVHIAHALAMRKEWQDAGSPGGFKKFAANYNQGIFDDIRQTIDSAPKPLADALLEAVRASYLAYKAPFTEGNQLPEEALSLNAVLQDIQNQNEAVTFVGEFLRQAVHLKRDGRITEDIHATIVNRLLNQLRAFIAQSLQKLRQALPGIEKGEFGPLAQRTFQKIEAELDTMTNREGTDQTSGDTEGFATREFDPKVRHERSDQNPPSIPPITGFAPGSAKVYGNFKNSTEDELLLGFIQNGKLTFHPVDASDGFGHNGIMRKGLLPAEVDATAFSLFRYKGRIVLHPASELNSAFPEGSLPSQTIEQLNNLLGL